ncbi:MAG: hypothetical protein KW793_01995 [Candidatus Doudnabacteria bacterium]|nr:hypothetical protein [Candidatus Doudnabacteria bacterium]
MQNVVTASTSGISLGTPITATTPPVTSIVDGTLVKDSSSPAIYIVEYGKKRPFTSFDSFRALGFSTVNVKVVSTSGLPLGDVVVTSARHTRGTLINLDGTIYFLGAIVKYGFPSAQVFTSWGRSFSEVVAGNSYDRNVSSGAVVEMKY